MHTQHAAAYREYREWAGTRQCSTDRMKGHTCAHARTHTHTHTQSHLCGRTGAAGVVVCLRSLVSSKAYSADSYAHHVCVCVCVHPSGS